MCHALPLYKFHEKPPKIDPIMIAALTFEGL